MTTPIDSLAPANLPISNQPLDKKRVLALADALDLSDQNSVLDFGTDAQKQLTDISNDILAGMSGEEAGEAGKLLTQMVTVLQGFRGNELKIKNKPSLFSRLVGRNNPTTSVGDFLQKFDTVSEEIDQISNGLETRKQKLLIDIKTLDKLYAAHLTHFHELDYYIAAAEEIILRFNERFLPPLESKLQRSGSVEDAQLLREQQIQRDELERRLHDLRLTKQVAMQALPSIRLLQENNRGLVNKINSTLLNTVPLWRQQLAQAIILFRSHEAAEALKQSHELTNQLLTANAEGLQRATHESRKQVERGTFDLAAVEKANQMLIQTIEESLAIHEDGRKMRNEAVSTLQAAEDALKDSLHKVAQKN